MKRSNHRRLLPFSAGSANCAPRLFQAFHRSLLVVVIIGLVSAAYTSAPTTRPTAGPTTIASVMPQPTLPLVASPTVPLPTAPPPTATAFDAVLAQIGPNGEVSPEMALEAFALAVAPIPGVTPPAGEPGELDADAAVAWVYQVWDQLSPAQQSAIEAALAPMSDPFQTGAPAAGAGHTLAARQPQAAEPECGLFYTDGGEPLAPIPAAVQPYVDMVKEAYSAIAGHLRRQTVPKLAVCLMPTGTFAANALARPFDAEHTQLGLPVSCAIYLNADTIGTIQAAGQLGWLMATETYACFKMTADPTETLAAFGARVIPPWVSRGGQVWVGATVAIEKFGSVGEILSEPWAGYLLEPERSLFRRGPSAIGFFAQVDHDPGGSGAWSVLDEMLTSADTLSAFYVATGRRQAFIDLWAAGYAREDWRGADWDIVGPGISTVTAKPLSIKIANGQSREWTAPSMAVAIANLSVSADVTVLAGNHLRVHDGEQDLKDVRNQAYCTKTGSGDVCACPKGSPGAKRPALPTLNLEDKLALTGMEFGGSAMITGLSLTDYCGQSYVWSMVFWSPNLGDTSPPLFQAYTCDGLESTWHAIFFGGAGPVLERIFDLPFDDGLVVHQDVHWDIPHQQSPDTLVDYAIDFELDPTSDPPVFIVTGTKTETAGGRSWVLPPRDFGSDAPLPLLNVSLETQLKPYPQYQHPFRAQALAECGG